MSKEYETQQPSARHGLPLSLQGGLDEVVYGYL